MVSSEINRSEYANGRKIQGIRTQRIGGREGKSENGLNSENSEVYKTLPRVIRSSLQYMTAKAQRYKSSEQEC